MNRRRPLATGGVAVAGGAGLLAVEDLFESNRAYRLGFVEVVNATDDRRRVRMRVRQDGTERFDESTEIRGRVDGTIDGWLIAEPWMQERSRYAFRLDLDGGRASTYSTTELSDLSTSGDCLRLSFLVRSAEDVGIFPRWDCSRA